MEHDEEMHPGLHAAATELMSAIKRNDAKGVAMAFESAFQILELGEHVGEPRRGRDSFAQVLLEPAREFLVLPRRDRAAFVANPIAHGLGIGQQIIFDIGLITQPTPIISRVLVNVRFSFNNN